MSINISTILPVIATELGGYTASELLDRGNHTGTQATSTITNYTSYFFQTDVTMLFQLSSAPTGWVKQTSHDNASLRIVSGSISTGGTLNFTTVFASGLYTGNTTLTTAHIPAHTHSGTTSTGGDHNHTLTFYSSGGSSGPTWTSNGTTSSPNNRNTDTTGSHSHTFTTSSVGSGGAHNHSLSLNVKYVDFIIAKRS